MILRKKFNAGKGRYTAQDKDDKIAAVDERFRKAWNSAKVKLSSSRMIDDESDNLVIRKYELKKTGCAF